MKILVGKCFGLGNACMSVPMLHALRHIGHDVDVLIGSTPSDAGAFEVMKELRDAGRINNVWIDHAPLSVEYDIAIMAIPFDGRWQKDDHFSAKRVMDGRPRPDPSTFFFGSWKKHESSYQVDNARELGYTGVDPFPIFTKRDQLRVTDQVYLGLGFKRSTDEIWTKKHWGNERYAAFIHECLKLRPQLKFVSTGNLLDFLQVGNPISKIAPLQFTQSNFAESIRSLGRCEAYFGNDTGMMHVAASFAMPVYGMMAFENLEVKNPPLCPISKCNSFASGESDPVEVARDFVQFVWG